MVNKSNLFWTVYKKLEKDVLDLTYYIHFSDEENEYKVKKEESKEDEDEQYKHKQLWTYSNQIADILIAISTQIEALFIESYKKEFNTKKLPDKINKLIAEMDKKWNLSEKQVKIISKNMYFTDKNGFGSEFAPMGYKDNDENDYYSAYCAVKHNRANALYKANINALVRALAALFILNVYYSFEEVEIDNVSELDFTLGSDVFIVKFSQNKYSLNDILIVSEDVEYLQKISAYADSLPDFDSGKFLEFTDNAKEPKRFTVRLNK